MAARTLSKKNLSRQKELARFEHLFNENPGVNHWQAPGQVRRHIEKVRRTKDEKRQELVARALQTAFTEVCRWDEEPAPTQNMTAKP